MRTAASSGPVPGRVPMWPALERVPLGMVRRGAALGLGARRGTLEVVSSWLEWPAGSVPRGARLRAGTRRGVLEMVSVWLEWPTGVVVGARRWGFGARG